MPTNGDQTGPQRVPLPIGGAAGVSAYRDQPGRFLPSETLRNLRPYDVARDHPRLGTTPGIIKLFNQRFGPGTPIQWVGTVARASVIAGYHLGAHTNITGRSVNAGPITGQVFGFAAGVVPGLEWDAKIDVSGEGGPATLSVNCIDHHTATDLTVVGTAQYSNGSDPFKVCRVVAFDRYGAQVWSTKISNSAKDVFINTVSISRLYTFVAANESVYAIRNDTGAIAASTNCNLWSTEVVEARVWQSAGGTEYVFALFTGTGTGVTALPNGGSVTAGFYAQCFRAGVMKFQIPSGNYGQTPIFLQAVWGRARATTDPFYEAAHGYFRFADNSELGPRGAVPTAMDIDGDGNVYVTRCNCAGGPTASYPPDLTQVRPISVCKISALGGMLWESDTDSIIRVGSQGVLNDIPTGAGIEPSLQAIAVDSLSGLVFVGGAPNAATSCAFCLNSADGILRWTRTLEPTVGPPNQTIRQAAIRVDPSDGHPVLGGDNSTAWPGAGGAHAHTWKLNSVDGSVIWTLNLSASVSCLGVTITADGRIALVTDQI